MRIKCRALLASLLITIAALSTAEEPVVSLAGDSEIIVESFAAEGE